MASRKHNASNSPVDLRTFNKFSSLACPSNERSCDENCERSDSCICSDVIIPANVAKRPRRPEIVTEACPERNVQLSWRKKESTTIPGNATYSDMTKSGSKIALIGDSVVKRVLGGHINRKLKRGRIFVRSFVGSTCQEVAYHAHPELNKSDVDTLVVNMGTNNIYNKLPNGKIVEQTAVEIATEIVECSRKLQSEYNINNLYICTLTPRTDYPEKLRNINANLRKMCKEGDNFSLISHDNISVDNLYDNVHLDNEGLSIYTSNVIDTLNKSI